MNCTNCGDEISKNAPVLTAPGGWCAPSETLYDLPLDPLCGDCKARLLFASEFGFDPGRRGENLKVPRGGIRYEVPE